jgi:hypothetical protein
VVARKQPIGLAPSLQGRAGGEVNFFFAFCFELIEKTFIFAIESFLITKKNKAL